MEENVTKDTVDKIIYYNTDQTGDMRLILLKERVRITG